MKVANDEHKDHVNCGLPAPYIMAIAPSILTDDWLSEESCLSSRHLEPIIRKIFEAIPFKIYRRTW